MSKIDIASAYPRKREFYIYNFIIASMFQHLILGEHSILMLLVFIIHGLVAVNSAQIKI